mmetsp:Transcript_45184/g.51280  ORF Transcript_45184/g.51280 Transcript_45184/m.51280 type:complete len:251 (+) Transcript_45184:276-1028(+)
MLDWVLGETNRSPIHDVPAHEREFLLMVHKDVSRWGYEQLSHTCAHYKGRMPRSTNTSLYLLEELGHRHQGRVYRAMSKNGNLCVLKYFVKSQYVLRPDGKHTEANTEIVARKAVDYWNTAYQGWLPPAVLGKWGGGDAILMPDLETIAVRSVDTDRIHVLQMLKNTLRESFFEKGLWHGDPAWRNVALVRNKENDDEIVKVVMLDLEPQRMLEQSAWQEQDFVTLWTDFQRTLDHDWDTLERAETETTD